MFKFIFTLALFSATYAKEEAGYPAQPYGYGHKPGGYYRKSFPPPRPVIDPKYYKTILEGFQQCVHHKCNALPHAYTSSYEDSLESIGEYTACVTSCAAAEMMRVCIDLKSLLAKLLDIGSSHLASAHRYLAGTEYYDVLGNNTRIDDSCCLPSDYFVPFENLVFYQPSSESGSSTDYFFGIKDYLDYCLQESADGSRPYFDTLGVGCNLGWMKYIRELQLNAGHLVLSPKCDSLAPDDACSEDLQNNPRAASYGSDMCVAYEWEHTDGSTREFESPILRYPTGGVTSLACDDEVIGDLTIKYHRVPSSHLKYFTVLTGLPLSSGSPCDYTQGLSSVPTEGAKYVSASTPNGAATIAARDCPLDTDGVFEYCHIRQYASWLQTQLFDVGSCPFVGLRDQGAASEDLSPFAFDTLACLYRVVSLKCDCMEAVLNCYEHEYEFTSSLGKTLGKAASVMCGFILCQKPEIFSLLGGQASVEHSRILQNILLQVGLMTPRFSSIPPATIVLLSFGMGMVAFIITKKQFQKRDSKVAIEEGYHNLI